MPKQNAALKREVRARMAETGENYTTALRRIQEQRQSAQQAAAAKEAPDA